MLDLSSVPCHGACLSALCAVKDYLSWCCTGVQQSASMPFSPFSVPACNRTPALLSAWAC